MPDPILRRLETIRERRCTRAQAVVNQASAALRLAHERCRRAHQSERTFAAQRPQLREQAYQEVLGKIVQRSSIEGVYSKLTRIDAKAAELADATKAAEQEVVAAEDARARAAAALRKATAKLEGFRLYLEKQRKLALLHAQRQEDAQIDDFAEIAASKRLVSSPSLVVLAAVVLSVFMVFSFFGLGVRAQELSLRLFGANIDQLARQIESVSGRRLIVEDEIALTIEGQFSGNSVDELLDDIGERYPIDWYTSIGQEIHLVSRSARTSRAFTFDSEEDAINFEVLYYTSRPASSDFPVVRAGRVVTITAPPNFNEQVERLINRSRIVVRQDGGPAGSGRDSVGFMFFPLLYASSSDRALTLGEQTIEIPGIASLMSVLLGIGEAPPAGAASLMSQAPSREPRSLARVLGQRAASAPQEAAALAGDSGAAVATPPYPRVFSDTRTNSVIVHDNLRHYAYYASLIDGLDIPLKMVELEAIVVDVDESQIDSFALGFRTNDVKSDSGSPGSGFGFGSIQTTLPGRNSVAVSINSGPLGQLTAEGFLAQIEALKSEGKSRVVSRPKVLTVDHHDAVVGSEEEFFVRVNSFQDSGLFPVKVGTSMRVVPHIVPHDTLEDVDRIRLYIEIRDGVIDQSEAATVDGLPRVARNNITTQAVVREGDALLIGGQTNTRRAQSDARLPLFGYVPLLRYFFSRQSDESVSSVRLVMIKPRIVVP